MKFVSTTHPLKTSAVVSKSVARKAVERNRLRRAVYRALDSVLYQQAGFSGHGHAVLFVQKIPPQELSKAFNSEVAVLFKNAML